MARVLQGEPMDFPCVPFSRFICDRLIQHGHRTAMVESGTGRELTFRQALGSIRRLANGLRQLGLKKGDVVCAFSTNNIDYPVLFCAVSSLGGILQATNPSYNSNELRHTLQLCKTKYVVTTPDFLPVVKEALTKAVQKIVVFGDSPGCVQFSSLVSHDLLDEPINDNFIDPKKDVIAILFSSGTTGKPKGVQHTHYSLVSFLLQVEAVSVIEKQDVMVSFLPIFHIFGLGVVLCGGLYTGALNVIMDRFDPEQFLTNIQKYKATNICVVPPVMVFLTTHPIVAKFDLSSVSSVACGAAPLSKAVENKALKLFNIQGIKQGYGMTECPATHVTRKGRFKFGTVGEALPGVEHKIINPDTQEILSPNKDGEVCVRSPAQMVGYISNPQATAEMLDKDGWLHTGDVGHIDSDGFLYIVDRIKELIKYKGFQVAPAELEDILLSHQDESDAAVIGVPDVEAGELPKAFVVKKPGSAVTDKDVQNFVNVDYYCHFNCRQIRNTFVSDVTFVSNLDIQQVESATGRELTFRQTLGSIRRLAHGLRQLGLKKGDVLCAFSTNNIDYPVLFCAVSSLGGIFQGTNPSYNANELRHSLELCKTKYVVTTPDLLPVVKEALPIAVQKIVVFGDSPGCIHFSSLVSHDLSDEPINDNFIDPKKDVTAIFFSSGTTGKPKGVQHTHYSLVSFLLQVEAVSVIHEQDVMVTFLPFFHIYGLVTVACGSLSTGAINVIMDRFDPVQFLTNIQKYKVTNLCLAPPVMLFLTTHPIVAKFDLSSVSTIFCGAAPLSKEVGNKALKLFNIQGIRQGYGMTECPAIHFTRKDRFRFGSVGEALPGVEYKIINPDTQEILPPNKDGEVCVRSPGQMVGYISNPDATAETLDKDGWLHTGDVGHVDSDGFLYIVDRIKELIKYKGFQVAPAELEDILLSHPDVADAAVIGIPDVEAGELPKAFVVKKPGSAVTDKDVQNFVNGKVSGTKKLRGGVEFIQEVPKSPSGKILRRLLRDTEEGRQSKL